MERLKVSKKTIAIVIASIIALGGIGGSIVYGKEQQEKQLAAIKIQEEKKLQEEQVIASQKVVEEAAAIKLEEEQKAKEVAVVEEQKKAEEAKTQAQTKTNTSPVNNSTTGTTPKKSTTTSNKTSTSPSSAPSTPQSSYYVAPPTFSSMNTAMRNKLISFGEFRYSPSGYSPNNEEPVFTDLNNIVMNLANSNLPLAEATNKFMNYDYKTADHSYCTRVMKDHAAIGYFETTSNDAKEIYNKIKFGAFDYNNAYVYYNAERKVNCVAFANAAFDDYFYGQ